MRIFKQIMLQMGLVLFRISLKMRYWNEDLADFKQEDVVELSEVNY
jgi:hypothetical protein